MPEREIPKDLMEAATQHTNRHIDPMFPEWDALVVVIAKAMLTERIQERERCARIANTHAGSRRPSEFDYYGHGFIAAAQAIEDAIRQEPST